VFLHTLSLSLSLGTVQSFTLSPLESFCVTSAAAEVTASSHGREKIRELFWRFFCLSDFAQTALNSSIRKLQSDMTV
jgi:hypothetical protein